MSYTDPEKQRQWCRANWPKKRDSLQYKLWLEKYKERRKRLRRGKYKSDPTRVLSYQKVFNVERREVLWQQILNAFGRVCSCCGCIDEAFLTLQHKQGGGRQHRLKRNIMGVYIDVIREGFPKDKYGLLCANCNWAEGIYGECPHETRRKQQNKLEVVA